MGFLKIMIMMVPIILWLVLLVSYIDHLSAVYVFYNLRDGAYSFEEADICFIEEGENGLAGSALAGGDIDGDSLPDLLISARQESSAGTSAGAVYLLTEATFAGF